MTGLHFGLLSTAAPCDEAAPDPFGGGVAQTAGPGRREGVTEAGGEGEAPQKEAGTLPVTGGGNPMDCSVLLRHLRNRKHIIKRHYAHTELKYQPENGKKKRVLPSCV